MYYPISWVCEHVLPNTLGLWACITRYVEFVSMYYPICWVCEHDKLGLWACITQYIGCITRYVEFVSMYYPICWVCEHVLPNMLGLWACITRYVGFVSMYYPICWVCEHVLPDMLGLWACITRYVGACEHVSVYCPIRWPFGMCWAFQACTVSLREVNTLPSQSLSFQNSGREREYKSLVLAANCTY